jgi:hypothetical protein
VSEVKRFATIQGAKDGDREASLGPYRQFRHGIKAAIRCLQDESRRATIPSKP